MNQKAAQKAAQKKDGLGLSLRLNNTPASSSRTTVIGNSRKLPSSQLSSSRNNSSVITMGQSVERLSREAEFVTDFFFRVISYKVAADSWVVIYAAEFVAEFYFSGSGENEVTDVVTEV